MKTVVSQIVITIFMCGDVMMGRGIDQVLPHPGDPRIYEPYLKNATGYVELAEEANGPIQKPVTFSYIWGDALGEMDRISPDVRLINLETAVTESNDYMEYKGINYRMHPKNIPVITEAGIDVCALANNHVLDWGNEGLIETLKTLKGVKVKYAGAGRNLREAQAPAIVEAPGKGRVIIFSFGSETSGIPSTWAASKDSPGINRLKDFSGKTVRQIKKSVHEVKRPGDIVIVSIHWGGNWGFEISPRHRKFAHGLIDEAGVDVIHGHSSHHVKGIEVYKDKPILYGCGDFITDYEGIGGYEWYRNDLGLMYFASIDAASGKLSGLTMIPTQTRNFKVNRASKAEALWLRDTLNREGKSLGTHVDLDKDNALRLQWE